MVIGKLDIDKAVACHIYQIVTAKTVPEHHIILMAYENIANNPSKPFQGKLYLKAHLC